MSPDWPKRSDTQWDDRVAKSGPARPRAASCTKQIALGDAALDVLPVRRHRPALRRDDPFLAKTCRRARRPNVTTALGPQKPGFRLDFTT
jgi:hypothetical protein